MELFDFGIPALDKALNLTATVLLLLALGMLLIRVISPEGKKYHLAAAFPSACGKTNLAMLRPTIPGWRVETLGDDIAWLRPGDDGRLWAINPEAGFFGVAPGTGESTNVTAVETLWGNTIFTNVALDLSDNTVWWEGLNKTPPARAIDWRGRPWTPQSPEKAAHPNSRFTAPARNCPCLSPEFDNPEGVPISAIIFGGRRAKTAPLVYQSFNWQHGVFIGSIMASETTAAATGRVGVVRRDPMAMLPFIGYHVADYVQHWLDVGTATDADLLPKIFYVNWFRRDADGRFMWPGFGENSRVLKWVAERIEGTADAVETPIGLLPAAGSLDVDGLDIPDEDLAEVVGYKEQEWRDEVPRIGRWFDTFGWRLPREMVDELVNLEIALGTRGTTAE